VHEFALADAVMKAACRAARDAGMSRITSVTVRVGELQQIETDLFEFSLSEVLPAGDPLLEGTRFVVEAEPVRFRCRVCGLDFGRGDLEGEDAEDALEAMHFIPELCHAFLRCPGCGSPDFAVTAGRGVTISGIEGHDSPGAGPP
jgi:hydrogenase nickel incorporation protein HypA/HybF